MEIKLYPDEALSTDCDVVTEFNEELHNQLDQMKALMRQHKGLGLSANQVGITQRFFIMEVLAWANKLCADGVKRWAWHPKGEILELINPRIIEASEEFYKYKEGCLSAPSVYDWVPDRWSQIVVEFDDRHGQTKKYATSEIMSVCVQHEIDHLNGVFFFDRLSNSNARAARKRWKKKRSKLGL